MVLRHDVHELETGGLDQPNFCYKYYFAACHNYYHFFKALEVFLSYEVRSGRLLTDKGTKGKLAFR